MPRWHKSSRCVSSGCMEAAVVDDRVLLRDSKVEDGEIMSFAPEAWTEFVEGIKAGRVDPLAR